MSIRLSPVSLVLGALITFGLFLLMGQAGPGTPPASWGPPKKSIVNVFDPQPVTVQPGAHHVVYQVPADRWLTVTAVFADAHTTSLDRFWAELHAGSYLDRGFAGPSVIIRGSAVADGHTLLSTPEVAGGTVGWVFRPGSQVVIRNTSQSPETIKRVALVGYESRD